MLDAINIWHPCYLRELGVVVFVPGAVFQVRMPMWSTHGTMEIVSV